MKFLYKRYFNHKTRLNRCRNRIFHEKLHISMYIRHIDHRSGAPWGPHGREGGKKFSRQSRDFFFRRRGPMGGPHIGFYKFLQVFMTDYIYIYVYEKQSK